MRVAARLTRRPAFTALALGAIAMLAACGNSSKDKTEAHLQLASSWSSAATLTTEQWLRSATPDRFAVSLLETSAKALDQADSFDSLGVLSRGRATFADSLVKGAQEGVVRISKAIASSRREVVTSSLAPLQETAAQLRALHDSVVNARPR